MISRTRRLALVVFVSFSLGGCSAVAGNGETPAAVGGTIELAVSETCAEGSDPQCITVGDQYVVRPSAFEQATVDNAVVSEGQQQNAFEVTFTPEGANVLNAVTDRAAQAGPDARLVIKLGNEVIAAVVVMEALDGDEATIALSPEDDPQEVVDLLSKN